MVTNLVFRVNRKWDGGEGGFAHKFLKGGQPRAIPDKFSKFRGEELNVIIYQNIPYIWIIGIHPLKFTEKVNSNNTAPSIGTIANGRNTVMSLCFVIVSPVFLVFFCVYFFFWLFRFVNFCFVCLTTWKLFWWLIDYFLASSEQYFSYIQLYCGVSFFFGGRNRRKPPTCRKSLPNFIT